ncbi:MAG: hypothetical protein K2X76_11835 [Sphingomonas sp.]|nr:hypothetical protein [Sphingomonas sp.]
MSAPHIARFGAAAVPWTVGWTGEEEFFVDRCPFFHRPAIFQLSAPGVGKPRFSKPHSNRQREAIARGLCDLCGKPLKHSTKVSLSHARPQPHGAEGWAILQVEPMLHRACAAESLRFCPSLRRDIDAGTLKVRQVLAWRAQCAIMSEEYIAEVTGQRVQALGHGKVELLKWIDRDQAWLGARHER